MDQNAVFTDMAVEFCRHKHHKDDGLIKYYEVEVDQTLSKQLGKPCGKYATLETTAVIKGENSEYHRVVDALTSCLKSYCKGCDKVLAVGLGNPDLTADALGDRVFKRLSVNRHLSGNDDNKYLCALTPNVLGMTGIESFDIISAVVDRVKPNAVVVVDALTAAAASRIATAFQVTDSGITPGSGVENHRRRLDEKSLGVRTVSVGVPLVVYSSTIVRDYCACDSMPHCDMIVTPKDVDILVEDCASIIAGAINNAFGGEKVRA
ncbi:MAG: GPR endopeptidase [Clostridiales bacterium]|nr:GPR endopeptidase [Clostridiales bacterium]